MSFWKKALCILLLTALLPVSLLWVGASLPEFYGESYYAELPEMYRRLRQTRGAKIVLVGGSNIAFGVDTELLEQLLGQCGYDYTVCSFGLYGAVGSSAMLELSEGCLGEGDIAVLAIEPTSESFSDYFGATAFWKCAESAPELLASLNSDQLSSLLGNYPEYLRQRLEIARTGILPSVEGVYGKASFNDRCDMVYDRPGNSMALGYDTGTPIDLSAVSFQPAFVEQVSDYCESAQKRGAAVVMSFSPMNRGAITDDTDDALYHFFRACQDAFPCTVISDPNDYLLNSGWFYDNNFHLNTPGARLRTMLLAEDLLSYLGCYQALRCETPEMPDPVETAPREEAESADFIFQALEDGWIISGLTEDGAQRTSLTLPGVHLGKPVVGFTAETFTGNTLLTELILPANIENIPDGAFSGCENLTRLVLLHTKTTPVIGGSPFDGAERLTIFVPSGAWPLYRDGAGCGRNPWEAYHNRIQAF